MSLTNDTMSPPTYSRTISSYQVLPPKVRLIEPPHDSRTPVERSIADVDVLLRNCRGDPESVAHDDIVALVAANQSFTHELTGRHLAHLVQERRELGSRQIADIQTRLTELRERMPFKSAWARRYDDGEVTDLERQIDALEMQKRTLELALWRDTQELRTGLVDSRRELDTARRRIGNRVGGIEGGY